MASKWKIAGPCRHIEWSEGLSRQKRFERRESKEWLEWRKSPKRREHSKILGFRSEVSNSTYRIADMPILPPADVIATPVINTIAIYKGEVLSVQSVNPAAFM